MGIKCRVLSDDQRNIVVELPITLPTALVRIKDKDGNPVGSVRQQNLRKGWYIEWQISYFDENKELVELGEMFRLLVEFGKLNEAEIKELYQNIQKRNTFFEEIFSVCLEESKKPPEFEGFVLWYRKNPILRKYLSDGSIIHIELRHKQKAVGYQAMLYLFIPIENVRSKEGELIINRPARQKEVVVWFPKKEHIIELVKAFSCMSRKHFEDIMSIVRSFLC